MNSNIKFLYTGITVLVFVLSFLFGPLKVFAAADAQSAVLTQNAVAPSGIISVNLTVNASGSGTSNDWNSTGWRIATSPGSLTCVDTPDNSNGDTDETFNINAPSTPGLYNAYFVAYNGNGCTSGGSTLTLTNAVFVVSGWNAPTIATEVSDGGSDIVEANGLTSNNSYATFNDNNDIVDYKNFGYLIPASATIDGIEVSVEGKRDGGVMPRTFSANLSWNNGTSFATAKNGTDLTTTERIVVLGSPTDKWGSHVWAPGDFNNGNFLVRIDPISATGDLDIDQIQVKVYYTVDATAPVLAQITVVPTTSSDTTPSYVFSSTEAGAVTYTGDCGSGSVANAVVGNNTVTYGPLTEGTYSNCAIKVTDSSSNQSNVLSLPVFTINANVFERGMVSLSFDDGTKSIYDYARPTLNTAGFDSTQYIISGAVGCADGGVGCDDFMTSAELNTLDSEGHEIAPHTRTDPCAPGDDPEDPTDNCASGVGLKGLSPRDLFSEVDGLRFDLLSAVGVSANTYFSTFAYPFGEFDDALIDKLKSAGISGGARTVNFIDALGQPIYNNKSSDRYKLSAAQVNLNTPISASDPDPDGFGSVEEWIDGAIAKGDWLILVFHEVKPDCGSETFCINLDSFSEIINYLSDKGSSVDVVTVKEGLALMNGNPVSNPGAPVVTITEEVSGVITVEATSSLGAPVSFTTSVTDDDTGLPSPLSAFCTIPTLTYPDEGHPVWGVNFPKVVLSGDTFPIGITTVTCTASDTGGNLGTKTFNINVVDTLGPVTTITSVKDGDNIALDSGDTTKSNFATVSFSATDSVAVIASECDLDGAGYTACTSPKDYNDLADGTHTVSVKSTDGSAFGTVVTFTWKVDTTAPVIVAHADVSAEATSPAGAIVSYDLPVVTDNISVGLTASCTPASGSTFALGSTEVTCNVTDDAGNAATSTKFDVNVSDTTPPVITLDGDNPQTIQAGSSYPELGATVTDNYDTGLEATIDSSSVNTSVLGSYTVTYNAVDSSGNTALEVTRTVNVIDTTKPSITILGDNPASAEVFGTYTDPGATANDNLDGDLSASIVTVNSVNTGVLGAYTVTYNVTDANGNIADEAVRTVNVIDGTKPVITLLGDSTTAVEVGSTYTDSGATASDNLDGDLTASIVTVDSVNTSVVGEYSVTYNVTDSNGNSATEVVRTVNVVDTTIPVIQAHENLASVEATSTSGTVVTYTAPLVDDNYDSQFSAVCTPAFGSLFDFGDTTINCTATDTSGNEALATSFTATVTDTTNPSVSVSTPSSPTSGAPSIEFVVTDNTETTTECKVDDGSFEACSSPFVPTITVDGSHTVTVKATDEGGNSAEGTSDSFTVDATGPVVDLSVEPDNNINSETLAEAQIVFAVSGATGDPLCSLNSASPAPCPSSPIDISEYAEGSYTFLVSALDEVGNTASKDVSFSIDFTVPELTVNSQTTNDSTPTITGTTNDSSASVKVKINDVEYDAEVTPTSGTNGTWLADITDSLSDGTYSVEASGTDEAGNVGTASGSVVINTSAPNLEINVPIAPNSTAVSGTVSATSASEEVTIQSVVVTISGNPSSDNVFDGDNTWSYNFSALTLTNGTYTITAVATDTLGNQAEKSASLIIDTQVPEIAIHENVTAEATSSSGAEVSYTLPSVTDNIDTNLVAICTPGSGSSFTLGETIVECSASDQSGNFAVPTSFTVTVSDTTPPVITLNGGATLNIALGSTYTEEGAVAQDAVEGSVSVSIGGDAVDTGVLGAYEVTYDAADSVGNQAEQVIRTVNVTESPDTTPPIITLNGSSVVSLTAGDVYTEEGATATDDKDGTVEVVLGGDTVDSSTPGSYEVTYNATDSAGNKASEVKRTILVTPSQSTVNSGGSTSSSGGRSRTRENDRTYTILDFNLLLVHWGETGNGNPADFNNDDVVDTRDFDLMIRNWKVNN